MRFKTTRLTMDDLTSVALSRAHTFQRQSLEKVLAAGWFVQTVKTLGGTTVVVVRHPKGGIALLAPNGMFQRPVKGQTTVKWDWDKMAALAEATIPNFNLPV